MINFKKTFDCIRCTSRLFGVSLKNARILTQIILCHVLVFGVRYEICMVSLSCHQIGYINCFTNKSMMSLLSQRFCSRMKFWAWRCRLYAANIINPFWTRLWVKLLGCCLQEVVKWRKLGVSDASISTEVPTFAQKNFYLSNMTFLKRDDSYSCSDIWNCSL